MVMAAGMRLRQRPKFNVQYAVAGVARDANGNVCFDHTLNNRVRAVMACRGGIARNLPGSDGTPADSRRLHLSPHDTSTRTSSIGFFPMSGTRHPPAG